MMDDIVKRIKGLNEGATYTEEPSSSEEVINEQDMHPHDKFINEQDINSHEEFLNEPDIPIDHSVTAENSQESSPSYFWYAQAQKTKMDNSNWSTEKTFQLVSLYQEYECLWNPHSEDYYNGEVRRAAELDIVARMGVEGFNFRKLRTKIKSVRNNYTRRCKMNKNIRGKSCCPDHIKRPKWFTIMDKIVKRIKELNRRKEFLTEEPVVPEEVLNVLDRHSHGGFINGQDIAVDHSVIITPENSQESPSTNINTLTSPSRSSPKGQQYLEEAVKELKSLNQNILQDKELNSSENIAFGSFVAASLEKLPAEQVLLVQQEIHSILLKHRLNALSSSNGIKNTKSTDQVYQIFLPNPQ